MYLSAITVLELEIDVLGMERRDALQGRALRSWLDAVTEAFSRILPFTRATATLCASMHVPDRRPDRNAMIAATAREHALVPATRNTEDFRGCGVQLFDPWQAATNRSG